MLVFKFQEFKNHANECLTIEEYFIKYELSHSFESNSGGSTISANRRSPPPEILGEFYKIFIQVMIEGRK